MSEADGLDERLKLTKLLADLDLLFAISFFDREKNDRTWTLTFDIGNGAAVTVQLAFFSGFLSVFSALDAEEEMTGDLMRQLLYLNGTGPTGALSLNGRTILASANIPTSRIDAQLLRESIGGVSRLASEVRRLLTDASIGFRERLRS